jgi:hypothetical protein
MQKIRLAILVFFTFVTSVNADGPLLMKGFHHDIPFDKACKTMSTFKSDRGDFITSKKHKKCGFGRNGLISYPHIIGSKSSNNVEKIILSPDVVNNLFQAETIKSAKFSRVFLNRYNWINEFRTTGTYRQESLEHGWKLSINRKKWIEITFFERDRTNFE